MIRYPLVIVTFADLNAALRAQFGPRYVLPEPPQAAEVTGYEPPDVAVGTGTRAPTGNTYYDPLVFDAGVVEATGKAYPAYEFPASTFVSVRGKNKVVETELVGRVGAVKELISAQDDEVTIAGLIVVEAQEGLSEEDMLAQLHQEMRAMKDLSQLGTTFDVSQAYLNEACGIYQLVVKELTFPTNNEYSNAQAFTITCTQDRPVELMLRDDDEATRNIIEA